MSIVDNKKAFHDYFIEERFEAGMSLEGWEVKAIRAGRAQIKEAYVIIRKGEVFLFGAHISPLPTASTRPLSLLMATIEGSLTTMPLPRA